MPSGQRLFDNMTARLAGASKDGKVHDLSSRWLAVGLVMAIGHVLKTECTPVRAHQSLALPLYRPV
jgi:hypothetical protein